MRSAAANTSTENRETQAAGESSPICPSHPSHPPKGSATQRSAAQRNAATHHHANTNAKKTHHSSKLFNGIHIVLIVIHSLQLFPSVLMSGPHP